MQEEGKRRKLDHDSSTSHQDCEEKSKVVFKKVTEKNDHEAGSSKVEVPCERSCHLTVLALIGYGAVVNMKDNFLNTPLHFAAEGGCEETVRVLLQHKAEVNAKNSLGDTPLHLAASLGHQGILKLLISHGGKVDIKGHNWRTALHHAAGNGNKECVSLLLEAGANVNAVLGSLRYSALHLAAWNGHLPCVKLLVEAGAEVNYRSRQGYTPLKRAFNRPDICAYLLSMGGIE